MQLQRATKKRALISLVPLVDVMFILLVFFMVTSTYLNLDIMPVIDRAEDQSLPPAPTPSERGSASALLLRLSADDQVILRGKTLETAAVREEIAAHIRSGADAPVILLPSSRASVQALVSTMEIAAEVGATALRVVRLEGTE